LPIVLGEPKDLKNCEKRSPGSSAPALGWVGVMQKSVTGRLIAIGAPGGHVHEVFWEVGRYRPPPELAPTYPNRPQRYVPRGAAVRRIDHVTFNTDDTLRDAHWYRDVLGYRFTELIRFDHAPNVVLGAFVSTTPMSHDLGLIRDAVDRSGKLSGVAGRANHVAFWLDQREDVLRACEVYRENGIELEFGPGRMRVELFSNGYMQYAPDVFPFEWRVSKGALNFWSPSQFAGRRIPQLDGDARSADRPRQ
jgi:catechol 2,3-dioxygenase